MSQHSSQDSRTATVTTGGPILPALSRALHDLYGILTLVYHEAEGLQTPSGDHPLFAFLREMDSFATGRAFVTEYEAELLPVHPYPETTLMHLTTALRRYHGKLRSERESRLKP